MGYDLKYTPAAERQIKKLPSDVLIPILERIEGLADNPRPVGAKKLAGRESLYRIRRGDYRVVYEINDPEKTITITKVGDRRDIYR